MADTCPACGKPIEPGDVKCPNCGAAIPAGDPPPAQKTAVIAAAMLPVFFVIALVAIAGGIIFTGMKVSGLLNRQSTNAAPAMNSSAPSPTQVPAELPPPAVPLGATPAQPPPNPPLIPPPVSPPVVVIPAAPPATAVTDEPLPPPPILSDFVPQIQPSGSPLVIRGQGLAAVDHVYFISTRGGAQVEAEILQKIDSQVIVAVPKITFENDGICLLITSAGGIAVMLDQHTGATPWGTDGHLHDTTVIVRSDDEISTGDNMLLVGREGCELSMGDNCTAFLERHVKVKSHGKNCHIYYVDPVELAPGVSRDGVTAVPSLQVNEDQDAFRVKPAPPDVDQ